MEGKVIEGVDLVELVRVIDSKRKSHQRAFLTQLEEIIGKDTKEFKLIRKLYLDHTSDYSREILTEIFGDTFEGKLT